MAEPVWQFYGASVRMHRIKKGWNQQRLAEEIGLSSKASISQIESAEAIPSGEKIIALARVFGVSPASMLTCPMVLAGTMESVFIEAMLAMLQVVTTTEGQRRVIKEMLAAMGQAVKDEEALSRPAPGAPTSDGQGTPETV